MKILISKSSEDQIYLSAHQGKLVLKSSIQDLEQKLPFEFDTRLYFRADGLAEKIESVTDTYGKKLEAVKDAYQKLVSGIADTCINEIKILVDSYGNQDTSDN